MALEIRESSECHFNIAVTLSEMGRKEEAIEHFRKAVKQDPTNVDTYISLGTTLASIKQMREAKEAF